MFDAGGGTDGTFGLDAGFPAELPKIATELRPAVCTVEEHGVRVD